MGQLSKKLRMASSKLGILMFWCPGCEELHQVRVGGKGWTFDGNVDSPTFTPSVLVTSGHHVPGHKGDCWCTFKARTGEDPGFKCQRCHSYVTKGHILFLADCTHALAGKTVPLPDLPAHLTDSL
jgi:hypothetical protein